MNDTVRTIWTAAKEQQLQELQKQKENAMTQNRTPITTFFDNNNKWNSDEDYGVRINLLVDTCIQNAEYLRDLFEPFDGRCTK